MTSHDLFLSLDGMLAMTFVLLSNSIHHMHEVDVVRTEQLCHRCNVSTVQVHYVFHKVILQMHTSQGVNISVHLWSP